MRGKPDLNFPAFDIAEKFLYGKGFVPVSPAMMDRLYEGWGPAPPADLVVDTELVARCMRRDVNALLDLRPENGDCLYVLHGWENSAGSKAEIAVARSIGLPIVYEFDLTFNPKM
jgi:hypothetical protein